MGRERAGSGLLQEGGKAAQQTVPEGRREVDPLGGAVARRAVEPTASYRQRMLRLPSGYTPGRPAARMRRPPRSAGRAWLRVPGRGPLEDDQGGVVPEIGALPEALPLVLDRRHDLSRQTLPGGDDGCRQPTASAAAMAAIVRRIRAVSTRTIFRSWESMSRVTGAIRAEPGASLQGATARHPLTSPSEHRALKIVCLFE